MVINQTWTKMKDANIVILDSIKSTILKFRRKKNWSKSTIYTENYNNELKYSNKI